MRTMLASCAVAAMMMFPAMAQTTETAFICNPKVSVANVRAGPGAKNFALLDTLPNKTPIKVLERTMNQEAGREWAKIEFKGVKSGKTETGYVDSISVVKECVQTAQAAPASSATGSAEKQPVPSAGAAPEPKLLSTSANSERPRQVQFRDDGALVVASGNRVWIVREQSNVEAGGFSVPGATKIFLSGDSRQALAVLKDKIEIYDVATGRSKAFRLYPSEGLLKPVWHPKDYVLFVDGSSYRNNASICIWDYAGAEKFACQEFTGGNAYDLALPESGQRIAFSNGRAMEWRKEDVRHDAFRDIKGTGYNHSVAFAPAGGAIVFGGPSGEIEIVSTTDWKVRKLSSPHGQSVRSIAFSRDGARFASVSSDGVIGVWDTQATRLLFRTRVADAYFDHVVFSPSGDRIATVAQDVRVWAIGDAAAVARLQNERATAVAERKRNETDRAEKAKGLDCDAVRDLDGKIGDAPQYPKCLTNKATSERAEAMKRLDCDAVRNLDGKASGEKQHAQCVFEKVQKTGTAREAYQKAVDYDLAKDRVKAKALYQSLRERFPSDDLAIEAAKRLTALNDVETTEAANERAAAAASSAADRAAASQRETREAIERSNREAAYQQQRQIAEQRQRDFQACISRKVACENSCDGIRDSSPRIRCKWGCASCQAP